MGKFEEVLKSGFDEGIESFEIPVAKRKTPIVITFCPTDEGLVKRYPIFFENVQKRITEMEKSGVKADVYGNGENEKDINALDEFKQICIEEIDKLLDYEGNGAILFNRCNPFRATKSGFWIEQVCEVITALIMKNAPARTEECQLNLSKKGQIYADKYLK